MRKCLANLVSVSSMLTLLDQTGLSTAQSFSSVAVFPVGSFGPKNSVACWADDFHFPKIVSISPGGVVVVLTQSNELTWLQAYHGTQPISIPVELNEGISLVQS